MMDIYVRVSDVRGREGDAYRSPGIQADECLRWLEREGVTPGKRIKDEDVSGAKPIADRGLEELIQRAEKGATQGVVVYALDRFGRDELDAALNIKRLTDAGARLVSASEGIDSGRQDQGSKMAMKMQLMFAEAYLDRVKANWRATTERVIGEGIHITGKPATGYVRKDQVEPAYNDRGELVPNGRLLVEPREAEVVREAFEMRARGVPLAQITRHAEARLGCGFGKSTVRAWIRNRVYLGEARRGAIVKAGAHEAIVTPELFEAAGRTTSKFFPRGASLSDQALLGGIVFCAACGHRMGVQGAGKGKGRKPFYVCPKHFADVKCVGTAALVKRVDDYVVWLLSQQWDEVASAASASAEAYLRAREALRSAEAEHELWLQDREATAETRRRMILRAEDDIGRARAALYAVDDPGVDEDAEVVWLDGRPMAYELWGEDRDRDRRHLRRYVREVRIAKADPKRRRHQPIEERAEVRWIDGSEPVVGA
jgi:DNA invertase Pin-like site-specific DNA recombinase